MHIILLQAKLAEEDIYQLPEEFPQFLFLSFNEMTYKQLDKDDWAKVKILYGSRLSEEEFEKAPELKWIHCPSPYLSGLCMDALKKSGGQQRKAAKELGLTERILGYKIKQYGIYPKLLSWRPKTYKFVC